MKAIKILSAVLGGLVFSTFALASEADTSAGVSKGPLVGGNAANASAHYEGNIGFARMATNTGRVNTARGVAVGVDNEGLTLSISTALATRLGPALAANFNISIERDGDVSTSRALTVAEGPLGKEASAGGSATTARYDNGSIAWGRGNAPLGRAIVKTIARSR